MPPKRKAPPANGRPSKRAASGVSTPVSRDSDGDFDESEDWDESEREAPHKYDSQSLPSFCSLFYPLTVEIMQT